MTVDPATAKHRAEHAGRSYIFCSARCRAKFTAEPARYLAASPQGRGPAANGEILWTCPMHPQIVRKEPGNCPICGMALERMTPAAGDAPNPELRDMTRRFWAGVALSLPLLAIAMAEHFNKAAFALVSPAPSGLGAADPRHAGGAVGRLAILSTRSGLGRQPPAQHVHADRARRLGRLCL
jgi:Cu+-exporting ATPase